MATIRHYILFLFISSSCATKVIAQTNETSYKCTSSDSINVTCGSSNDYIGKLNIPNNPVANAHLDIQKITSIKSANIYKVKVQGSDNWCFDISGDKTKTHGYYEPPIISGSTSSLMILAGASQKVNPNPPNSALKICNGPINNINTNTRNLNEFYLLTGNPQDINYLAQTPSIWVPDPNAAIQKVIDKTSPTVKQDSYLFIDLNEHNATKVLDLAQQGAFPYVLIYAWTWAKTFGSYPINMANYPHGVNGLASVSEIAAQHNTKIGLHILTALISSNDPFAANKDSLLKKNNAFVRHGNDYIINMKENIKNVSAQKIADVVNKVNPGMIYFDGIELATAEGNDPTYDNAEQQINILSRLNKKVLTQGSSDVARMWPYMSRMATADYSTLASIQYLDSYKIEQVLPKRINSLMPAELGWIGLLSEKPSYPATTVEDISTTLARTLALNLPFSIRTTQSDLEANPYTTRLFRIIGIVNRTLQTGKALNSTAKKTLQTGNWYLVDDANPYFAQLMLQTQHVPLNQNSTPLGITAKNASGIMLRLSNVHSTNNQNMIPLVPKAYMIQNAKQQADINTTNRGSLINTVRFTSNKNGILDLTHARQMSIDYSVKSNNLNSSSSCAVINAQLEDVNGSYRDYYLNVVPNHTGTTNISYLDAPKQMLTTLMPANTNYNMKSALYNFDFSKVTAINFRWMKACSNQDEIVLKNVSMQQELPITLQNIQLLAGNTPILTIPALKTGEILDVFPDGIVTICNQGSCRQVGNIYPYLSKIINQPLFIKSQGSNIEYDIEFGQLTTKVPLKI
ncbi:hypothetical protein [Acinetobacter sp. G18]|uniref:hypothetical protein n=1 Tax=Acinetobacter sp. G18 TaxID=2952152 RepID=UPI0040442E84